MKSTAVILTAIACASVYVAGCAASTETTGDADPASEASQAAGAAPGEKGSLSSASRPELIVPIHLPVTHEYVVTIDNFWVTYPRSKSTDTVTAGISLGWSDPTSLRYTPVIHRYRRIGNVSSGGVNVADFTATLDVANDKLVTFAVGLENVGAIESASGTSSEYVARNAPLDNLFALGPVWPVDSSFTKGIVETYPASTCDGIVAGDAAMQTGAELEALTANGPYTRTVMFPGTDSPIGCGRNSLYYLTWTIKRSW